MDEKRQEPHPVSRAPDEFNIVYFGGSITQGAGVSDYQKSWAAIVSHALEQRNKAVRCYNAGVGGTGSDYGLLRLYDDVISKKPDMVFVEFAVNDQDRPKEQVQKCLEGIVRNLLRFRPTISIVFLYTTTQEFRACTKIYQEIAAYYGIPSIDLQTELRRMVQSGKLKTEEFLADGIHPNEKGHQLYADLILHQLADVWNHAPVYRETPLREDWYPFVGKKINPDQAELSGNWEKEMVCDERVYTADQPGSRIIFQFTGNVVGLVHRIGREYGKCIIELDGVRQETDMGAYLDCSYDTACQSVMWYHDFALSDGLHRLAIILEAETEKGNKKENRKKLSVDFIYVKK